MIVIASIHLKLLVYVLWENLDIKDKLFYVVLVAVALRFASTNVVCLSARGDKEFQPTRLFIQRGKIS